MMVKRMNGLFSVILSIALVFNMLSIPAFADGDSPEGKITVAVHDDAPTLDVSGVGGTYNVNAPMSGHIDYDFGADDGADKTVVISRENAQNINVEGIYDASDGSYTFEMSGATVVLQSNGDFSYDGNMNSETALELVGKEVTYNFTITDADGDSVTKSATVEFERSIPTFDLDGAAIAVDEANLPDGTDPDASWLEGWGSFKFDLNGEDGVLEVGDDQSGVKVYNITDGQGSDLDNFADNTVMVNGVAITIVGIPQNNGAGDWTVNYHYKLIGRQTHERPEFDTELIASLPITLADSSGGDSVSAELTVTVRDDVPILDLADTELSTTSTSKSVNSHVDFMYGADIEGNLTVSGVEGAPVSGGTEFVIEGVGTVLLKQGGDFTFTAANGVTGEQVLMFVVTDSDGDTDTGSVKITVLYTPPTLPSVGSVVVTMDEGALENGTGAHMEHGTTNNGSFDVNLHGEDGTLVLSAGDQSVTIIVANDVASIDGNSKISVNNADVTFAAPTEKNADGSWKISYESALAGNARHNDPAKSGADDPLTDAIDMLVTDEDGQTASGAMSVILHDDAPVISKFTVGEGDGASASIRSTETVDGELGFSYGADDGEGKSISFDDATTEDGKTFIFANGSKIVLDEGGSYTFAPAGSAAGNQVLTFTVVDSDGDAVSKSVTVNVLTASGSASTSAKTAALSLANDNESVSTLSGGASGYVAPSFARGSMSLMDNGDTNTVPEIYPASEVRADIEESDTRHEADEGALANGTGAHQEHGTTGDGSFRVDLYGKNGLIRVGTLSFIVKDGESFAVPASSTTSKDGVTLTVTDITQGGDGKWTVSYGYVLTDSQTHSDPSASGANDTVEISIPIAVENAPIDAGGLIDDFVVDEGALAVGSGAHEEHGTTGSGSFKVNLHGEDGSITIGDLTFNVKDGDALIVPDDSMTEQNGIVLAINSIAQDADGKWTISYAYELREAQIHGVPGTETDGALSGKIEVSVKGETGDEATGRFDLTVHDDIPAIGIEVASASVDSGTSVDVGTWTHSFGADVPQAREVVVNGQVLDVSGGGSVDIAGQHGTLTVGADGTCAYRANPNAEGEDSFTLLLGITDADGDTASASADLKVTVADSTSKPEAVSFSTQDADVLAGGSDTDSVAVPEGYVLTEDSVANVNAAVDYGRFSLDGGSLVFTQSEPYAHAQGEEEHSFPLVQFAITDPNGNVTTLDATVRISDDTPAIGIEVASASVDSGTSVDVGTWTHSFGADVPQAREVVVNGQVLDVSGGGSVDIAGQHGTLTVGADGTCAYRANPNAEGEDSFTLLLGITDADGDTASASADLKVTVVASSDVDDDSPDTNDPSDDDSASKNDESRESDTPSDDSEDDADSSSADEPEDDETADNKYEVVDSPDTSDTSNLLTWVVLLFMSSLAACMLAVLRKSKIAK